MQRASFKTPRATVRAQRGFSLIMALIFLVLLTLLGVTAMQTATLEERMAGNLRNENLALQAAEAALREAEAILSSPSLPSFTTTPGLYDVMTNPWPGRSDPQNWSGWAETGGSAPYKTYTGLAGPGELGGVAEPPRFVIEQLRPVLPGDSGSVKLGTGITELRQVFRITARGVGGTTNSVVVLESTFWK